MHKLKINFMTQIELLLKEMDSEAETTRKMLTRVPDDKFDWKPHTKSMNMKSLGTHVAELPTWVSLALTTDGLDFEAGPYAPAVVNTTGDLVALFEKSFKEGRAELVKATDADLLPNWTMRSGDVVHSVMTKYETIRHAFCQTVHHRAQLGVFLRLLDIPIPGSYGPSADEQGM
jgi:uncharacterized damage-inducible protein DinB